MAKTACAKLPVLKLAPASKSARRLAAQESGRRMTDTEIVAMFPGCESRAIPTKLAVLDRLLTEAWELVHRLHDSGVRFAGSPHDAAIVIAGTAYAAWRISLGRRCRAHDDAHPVLVASGMNDGLEFAMWHKSGIPAMYADDYLNVIADSEDPIDRMTPIQAVAKVWPQRYAAGRVQMAKPRYARQEPVSAYGQEDVFWEHRPNILMAGRHELQRAKTTAEAKRRKAGTARKPKPK